MLKGVMTVGSWTMASRILGFLRDMLIASFVGTGPVADAFFVANRLPNLFRRLFGEGAFNAAFVPEFTGLLATDGHGHAAKFAQEAFGVMVFWLGLLTILGEVFMPQLLHAIAPGFARDPAKFELAITLSRITFPYLFLICLTALVSGVLNGLDRFAAAAAAPVLYNAFSIGAMVLLAPHVATVGHALAWGVSLSGIAQLALLIWAMHRAGMPLTLPVPRFTPQMRALLKRMAPGLVGAGVTQLNLALDTVIGSLLPAGAVSLLYYADRVNQLPLGVIGVAVGTALLPMLSRQMRTGDDERAKVTMNRAIELALFLTLPAALALAVSGAPIMYVLFARGAFTLENAISSSESLAAYAFGLPVFVLLKVLTPAFFARGDTSTPVKIGLATVALNIALNFAFMYPLQHIGPALATSVAAYANCAALLIMLVKRGQFGADARLVRRLPRMAVASLLMAVALYVVGNWMHAALFANSALRWGALVVLVSVGLGVYFIACQLLGAFDIRELAAQLRRRAAAKSDPAP